MVTDVLTALRRAAARRPGRRRHRRAARRRARPRATTPSRSRDPTSPATARRPRARRRWALERGASACCSSPATARRSTRPRSTTLLARRARRRPTSSIVPDRHGTGTNALLLAPPDAIAPELRARQPRAPRAALAREAGAACRVAEPPSLVLDVDTADDLAVLRDALDARDAAAPPTRAGCSRAPGRGGEPPRGRGALAGPPGGPPRRRPRRAARAARAATLRRRRRARRSRTRSSRRPRARIVALADVVAARARARARRASTARTRATCRSSSTSRAELVRAERGVLICRTRHGFVCANAGVDASNAPGAGHARPAAARPGRSSARALRARAARRAPARRHHRLVRPRVAPRAGRGRDRRRRARAARRLARAPRRAPGASCARRRSRSPTRPRRPPTSCATRTRASRRSSSAASSATSPTTDGPGAAALLRPRAEDLFPDAPRRTCRLPGRTRLARALDAPVNRFQNLSRRVQHAQALLCVALLGAVAALSIPAAATAARPHSYVVLLKHGASAADARVAIRAAGGTIVRRTRRSASSP